MPIQKVTIQYIKSYKPKWGNSKLLLGSSVLERNGTSTAILDGVHNSTTSINYRAEINDIHANPGETVVARFTLIGGSAFKITGMLFYANQCTFLL